MSKYAKFLELSSEYVRVIKWAKTRIFGEAQQSPIEKMRKMVEMFDPDSVGLPRERYGHCLRHPLVGRPILHMRRDAPSLDDNGDLSVEMKYIKAVRDNGMAELLFKNPRKKETL